MRVEIDLRASVNENAGRYFALSKKFRKKLGGIEKGERELARKAAAEKAEGQTHRRTATKKREKKWYEKYHWSFTSEGLLMVAGKDAKSNENLVTKLMQEGDLYFHAGIHGAAHTIIKSEGKKIGENSKKQAAAFAAVFSSAWREKLPGVDVYSANPEQVTKEAPSGEAIGMGAFMIYGKREWYKKTPLEFSIGYKKDGDTLEAFSGHPAAVKARSDFSLPVRFGESSKGDAAKKILGIFRSRLGIKDAFSHDEIVALLPSGGISVANI